MADQSLQSLRSEVERLSSENEELRLRVEDAEQALEAIRTGQAESLVVEGPNGPRIFSLESADHSYRVLVEAMNEGAATLSDDWTILYCNARFAEMLDASLERVMGDSLRRFLPEPSQSAFDVLVREADGGESRGEIQLRGSNGHVVPAYLSMSVIHDDTRRRFCMVAADLRAQKRTEEVLAAERFARSVLEQAADAILVCDESGRIIRASESARELCSRDLLLQRFDEACPLVLSEPSDHADGASVGHRAMRGDVLQTVPASLQRPDGSSASLLISAKALHTSDDRAIGFVVTLVDVTERRRAEDALREADRRKNEFLAVLSHELRNPLAPIRNSTYILQHAPPGSSQAERALEVIDRQADQLSRLVDDLLDITRITRNKIRLVRQTLELNELVRSTMEDQRSLFEKAQVRLELRPSPTPVFVNGDASRLAQVFGNLLQNAAKFTSRGGETRIAISADAVEQRAVISVSDTGAGMAPEMVSRLFEPFSQADATLDRSKGGLGLGLALVKGLVELHGGGVTAQSAGSGRGAEFVVRIPLVAPTEASVPRAADASATRPRRVLIVEDNIDSAESLREVLEFGQHEVLVTYSGPEGIARAREFRPDVVVCDIGLPGMDGYEVARALRADNAFKDTLLVALSGYALPEDLQRTHDAGFDQHLAKPPSLEKLEACLTDPLLSIQPR